jgi:predicted XRE-type DNA-binding protein
MDSSEIYTITIATTKNFSIKQWMVEQTNQRITNRYLKVHIAEDMEVNNANLSRFLSGKTVTDVFYDKWFKWYIKQN